MVSCYFGLPGCGKSTMLTKIAYNESIKIQNGSSNYDYILSNVPLKIPFVAKIDFSDLGRYDIQRALILIDELTVNADGRKYKVFPSETAWYFAEHRHQNTDIICFSQLFGSVDKRIRDVTEKLFYMRKLGPFTRIIRIPKSIVVPKETGEITEGYRLPGLPGRIFGRILYRRKYYPYFDSWIIDRHLPRFPVRYYMPGVLSFPPRRGAPARAERRSNK